MYISAHRLYNFVLYFIVNDKTKRQNYVVRRAIAPGDSLATSHVTNQQLKIINVVCNK